MNSTEECCPKFDPEPFRDTLHRWEGKPFIRETMRTFLHMPYPGTFGRTVTRMWKKIEDAGATPEKSDFLMLCADPTPWRSELYIHSVKSVPNAENVSLSGAFMTKVFDGPFRDVGKWVVEMQDWMKREGKPLKNLYFYYTTCPKCAKKYGHNYVVGYAETE